MRRILAACLTVPAAAVVAPAMAGAFPLLTGVSAVRASQSDLLVFRFSHGPLPRVNAARVARVRQDGSGTPVAMRGRVFMEIALINTMAHRSDYRPTAAARVLNPNGRVLVQARQVGDFEAVVTYGVGLRRAVAPEVLRQPGSRRIVVRFPHPR